MLNRAFSVFVVLSFGCVAEAQNVAGVDCTAPRNATELAACLEIELRGSDARLNDLNQSIMARADAPSRNALRSQQRDWLHDRDSACKVTTTEQNRERWYAAVAANPRTAACIDGESRFRIAELQAMLDNRPVPSRAQVEESGSVAAKMAVTTPDAHGKPRLPTKHATGKWYFEVTIEREAAAKAGLKTIMAGFIGTADMVFHGTGHQLRTSDRGTFTIGCALDLDNGMIYYREGGSWHEKEPGSNRGFAAKLGQEYVAQVRGSDSISDLMSAGLIKANFGDTPFVYALPDGYRSWR